MEGNSPGSSSMDFPQSQDLFSDQADSEHDGEGDAMSHKTATSSQDDNSLFQDHTDYTPTRTIRKRENQRGQNSALLQNITSDDSSDYELPPKKLSLKEIFDNHFRKKRKKPKKKETRIPQGPKQRKPCYSVPRKERRRRLLHRGIGFPFTSSKYLPLKLCFAYEQSVLGGFLNHIKHLKFERHLQKSLKHMCVDEALEEEGLETRKLTYLDEEEALSPISESGDHDDHETEDQDAKIVEKESFILNCSVPKKKKWKMKRKIKKKNHRSRKDN
ncbi:TATA box-binding protein-associated factor RNA polymerase I subunit D [Hyperolius riggenbachi]|uniref:TATA box-binding protein-associated factor RNA polymerase I subunit D n=1 Tax=Hyperolius riggenbachi TaxID=752182 RepID=UPI0035A266AD